MIPKEQQTAWQRWELASFDNKSPNPATSDPLPTVSELENLREQARQEGYAAGLEEGRLAGYDAGFRNGREAGETAGRDQARLDNAAVLQQITALLQTFDAALAHADQQIGAEIVTFSCDLAAAMLKTILPVKPDLLLPLISDTINALPVMQRNGKIWLHPDDVPLVREHLQDELAQQGWQLLEDPHLSRGGCRIDTHSNQADASLQTRWERLMKTLGQNTEWLQT